MKKILGSGITTLIISNDEMGDLIKIVKSLEHSCLWYGIGYGIGFDRKAFFSIGNEIGKNVIIFGVNLSSSSLIDNRKKTF